jgi:DNA topoisomerase-1
VVAYNGRFGPYIKNGDDTRSLPAGMSPIDVTLEQALELLAQPKALRRGFGAKKEPLRVFDDSPVTKQKVQLLEGRYGLYLNDGETNASVPKGVSPEELTFADALQLLAVRAALGPSSKRPARRKKSAPKKAAPKKATPKKATKKAAPKTASKNGAPEPGLKLKVKKPAAKKKPAKRRLAVKKG